ncbi:RNA-directed DNA polymerase [Telmatobacter sp. DSM 110680]|uniref:RNA-directed DNA polymerase n=1 Tax=Telmatobacter sp. DSM 110680 TaxID=3036704 RepID=A0AAU7DNF7_9BACT
MTALSDFQDRNNLERAWRWIRSNPDPTYKRYCSEFYSRFAVADDLIIEDLQQRLQRGFYEPSHSCKFLMPKKSGILRPYSILTVEDQIVYQALVNVIAEKLAPKIRNSYLSETFGHIYAGKTSQWFYRRWNDGYKAFNQATRAAFKRGLVYTASFDLTACYDSLDHAVLSHFLTQLGVERDFCDFLRTCLSKWTANDRRIYQNHGIPQGPLSSGLLSEVVLQHFDQHYGPKANLVYLRYVDDIRLFATKEIDLRRMLVRLDRLSKDIGLFPQAAKIDIHRVTDIEKELKSISNPTVVAVRGAIVDQAKLAKRIAALSPRLRPVVKIEDETRFKFLLAHALPTSKLNDRLLTISAARPDLVPSIARYLKRYQRLPKSVAKQLIARVRNEQLYEYVTADWLDVLAGRLSDADSLALNVILKAQWKPRTLSPELKAEAGKRLIRAGLLNVNQTRHAILSVRESWVRAQLVSALNDQHYGKAALETITNQALRDHNPDVSLAAAQQAAFLGITVVPPFRTIQHSGGKALRQFGILTRVTGRSCGISWSMARLTGRSSSINWRSIFGSTYRHAERLAVQMRALSDTNVTAFVNAADVFNDRLLSRLYLHDPSLGTYLLGSIGSILSSTRLKTNYPSVHTLCDAIHTERLKSSLSHPIVKKTGKPTSRIPYRYLRKAKQLYVQALIELEASW